MRIVIDNCLPWRMAAVIRSALPAAQVSHLSELDASNWTDDEIRKRWGEEPLIWITRDEDFWMNAPPGWAVVWVNCHNPRLAFLRTSLAPLIARSVGNLGPGSRLLISEDLSVSF